MLIIHSVFATFISLSYYYWGNNEQFSNSSFLSMQSLGRKRDSQHVWIPAPHTGHAACSCFGPGTAFLPSASGKEPVDGWTHSFSLHLSFSCAFQINRFQSTILLHTIFQYCYWEICSQSFVFYVCETSATSICPWVMNCPWSITAFTSAFCFLFE